MSPICSEMLNRETSAVFCRLHMKIGLMFLKVQHVGILVNFPKIFDRSVKCLFNIFHHKINSEITIRYATVPNSSHTKYSLRHMKVLIQ